MDYVRIFCSDNSAIKACEIVEQNGFTFLNFYLRPYDDILVKKIHEFMINLNSKTFGTHLYYHVWQYKDKLHTHINAQHCERIY